MLRIAALLTLAMCSGATSPPTHAADEADRAGWVQLLEQLQARIDKTRSALPDSVTDFLVGLSLLDIPTGQRLSIAADTPMHAASTMKVPVLFELFRQADAGERSLDDSIKVENRFRSILDGSQYSLTPEDDSDTTLYARIGERVTYRELARLMIVRSSNLATNILIERVDAERVRATLARLNADGMQVLRGVEDTPAYRAGLSNTTTADGFLRTLEAIARCQLLTARSCREITGILADQEFDEGIPAGVAPGTRVANKTGWITGINHDGAIVYPPGRGPYVLVVLTRGIQDRAIAHQLIADLSRLVWQRLVAETGNP